MKVLSTVAATVVLGVGAFGWNWAATNIVLAGDLEGLAEMMAAELAKEIRPLAQALEETNKLANQNAADIRLGRIEATRQAIRDLRKEVQEMEQRRDSGEMWTTSDERLLGEWRDDLEDLQILLGTLEGSQ